MNRSVHSDQDPNIIITDTGIPDTTGNATINTIIIIIVGCVVAAGCCVDVTVIDASVDPPS